MENDHLRQLRKIMNNIQDGDEFDKKGPVILELFSSHGEDIVKSHPEVVVEMIDLVERWITTNFYQKIVEEMVEICKEIPWGPEEGPLQCLVSHLSHWKTNGRMDLNSLAQEILEESRKDEENEWPQENPLKDLVEELEIWGQELSPMKMYSLMQKIIKEYKKVPGWPKEEPLKSLVDQLNNVRSITDQKALLSLIQILVTVGEPCKSRTECLNILMTRAQYGESEEEFEVTEQFIHTLELLLKDGADPTWTSGLNTMKHSALYHFFQRIVFILAHKNHLSTALMKILASFLTEQCLNHRDPKSNGTVLHALFDIHWAMLPEDLPDDLFEQLKIIIGNVAEVKPALLDTTDCYHRTALHFLARALIKYPRIGHDLRTIITLVTTKTNVQVSDEDQVTPLSWILLGKAKWEKSDSKGIFSTIENDFVSKGANAKSAKAGLMVALNTWLTKVLSSEENTWKKPLRLQTFLDDIKDFLHPVTCKEYQTFIKEFKLELEEKIWVRLTRITNPKCILHVKYILKLLTKHQANAQVIWNSIVASWTETEYLTLNVLEILCLCAEKGAEPTERELQKILSYPEAITRKEKFAKPIIQTALALPIINNIFDDMAFLTEYYRVGKKMRKLGCELMHKVYQTVDECLKSKKLIDILLFISDKKGKIKPLMEDFVESLFRNNWLRRNPLHIAVIFLHVENSMKWFPLSLVTKYLHETDIHGCTPLHVAYLHHNEHAVNFLLSRGAREDVIDHFGMTPKALGSRVTVVSKNGQPQTVHYGEATSDTTEEHPDVKHFNLCKSVLKAKSEVMEKMKPMLVIDEAEAKTLFHELHTLFERLVRGTEYEEAKIKLCGSSRERMKTVCLDEADIQLRFKHLQGNIIAGKKWEFDNDFLPALGKCLINNLGKINWEGINLRPISVLGPWLFIREGDYPNKGMEVDVDVVAILVGKHVATFEEKLQRVLLEEGHRHRSMLFSTLETWQPKRFKPTFFAYEWEIIDSFPTTERLAIVICKALVQAYNTCKGDSSRVKMPITSYVIKTSVFYMLAYHAGYVNLFEINERASVLKRALESVEGPPREIGKKLPLNRNPRWATNDDLDQNGEEARVCASKIFKLIKHLAQQGLELEAFWKRNTDAVNTSFILAIEGFGKADYILDVCEYALDRLSPSVFY